MSTTITYQFCHYTTLASSETFAYMDQTFYGDDGTVSGTVQTILTGDRYNLYDSEALINDETDPVHSDGVMATQSKG